MCRIYCSQAPVRIVGSIRTETEFSSYTKKKTSGNVSFRGSTSPFTLFITYKLSFNHFMKLLVPKYKVITLSHGMRTTLLVSTGHSEHEHDDNISTRSVNLYKSVVNFPL